MLIVSTVGWIRRANKLCANYRQVSISLILIDWLGGYLQKISLSPGLKQVPTWLFHGQSVT